MHVLVFKLLISCHIKEFATLPLTLSKYIVTNISIDKLIIRAGPIIPISVVLSQTLKSSQWSELVATIAEIKSIKLHEESCGGHSPLA
jgi:hypothetical protein